MDIYRSITGGGNDSHVTQLLLAFLMAREVAHQKSFELPAGKDARGRTLREHLLQNVAR